MLETWNSVWTFIKVQKNIIPLEKNRIILRGIVSKILRKWKLGVGRTSRDHFFRIPHAKLGYEPKFQSSRTNFGQNFWFWVKRWSATGQNDEDMKLLVGIFFFKDLKETNNLMKIKANKSGTQEKIFMGTFFPRAKSSQKLFR